MCYYEKVKVIALVRQHSQQAENTVLAEFGMAVILHQHITPQSKFTAAKVKAAINFISSFMNCQIPQVHHEHLSWSTGDTGRIFNEIINF